MKVPHIAVLATTLLSSTLLFAEEVKPADGMAGMATMSGMSSMSGMAAPTEGMAAEKVTDSAPTDGMAGMAAPTEGMAAEKSATSAKATDSTATKPVISETDKLSYSFGHSIGETIKQQNIEVNSELMIRGIKDAMTNSSDLLISGEEVKQILTAYQQKKREEIMKAQAEAQMKASAENIKKGEAFLAENSKKEGVITLPSGLQYKVINEGKPDGKKPKETDTVTTHYRGTSIDGEEFDSSYSRNEPTSFAVNGVIPGWTEALQLMKEGAKWQLFVPAKLAYGERGAGGKIGPGQTLLFEVELISVDGQ